jgi:hypothetical protein
MCPDRAESGPNRDRKAAHAAGVAGPIPAPTRGGSHSLRAPDHGAERRQVRALRGPITACLRRVENAPLIDAP